ncbi:MAG: rane fusion protein YbhG [Candidatus Sumerlaeota bacterium]|nr:rane fusion protein YbhG [Candidatus Sumerlaeota bacterium]
MVFPRKFATAALVGVLMLTSGCRNEDGPLVASGRVEVDRIHAGSKIVGRVWKVNFEEGDRVPAGEAVVVLEQTEIRAQLAQAEATLAQATAQLDLLLAGTRAEDIRSMEAIVAARRAELELREQGFREEEIREAEAQAASARSALELARKESERAHSLVKTGAATQQDVDARESAVETAQASLDVALQRVALRRSGSRPQEIAMARAQLEQAEADLERLRNGPRPQEIAAAQAAVSAAKAAAERIQAQLEETLILSPVDTVVETLDLEPGDLVKAGQTVAVLDLHRSPWVRCYLPENRLGMARVGTAVEVTVDSYPGRQFEGTIRHIAGEAEFTPRNVQTTEKRAELVFEVKVDVEDAGGDLRAGMYADVSFGTPEGK